MAGAARGCTERKKAMRTATRAVLVVVAFLFVAITTTAATAQIPTVPCAGAFGTCLGSCPPNQECIPDPTTMLCGCVTVTTTSLPTTTTTTSNTTTTTIAPCCGFNPTRLSFTTAIGSGNCGTLTTSTGVLLENLACGGLYTGGGSAGVPLPFQVPDMGSSLTAASCSGTTLTLSQLTSTQTGSNRNCTSVGCLFGPPLPIPNSATTPISVCVINTVAHNASGSADCS